MKRHWGLIHRLEEKEKSLFLKKLTLQEGLRIFFNLHQLAYMINNRSGMAAINLNKIRSLSKTHFIFKRLAR